MLLDQYYLTVKDALGHKGWILDAQYMPGVQHMGYEVQLQHKLLYHPVAVGEESLPNSNFVLPENGRGGSNFLLTHFKRGLMTPTYVISNSFCT
ncbi:hypothetical protein TNCV_925671 [Trichonephila clavipes]|nr:hypothetical protein TNCV_925671 [Trichonephila clavipes]